MPDVPARASHLEAIAVAPREAGSNEEAAARAYCRKQLETHGFFVSEEPFVFSAAVGRYAASAAGFILMVAFAMTAICVLRETAPRSALGALVAGAAGVAVLGFLALRYGVLGLPFLRRRSINLVAVRGDPDLWLVAHLDSKSQPLPILVRAGAFIVLGLSLALALAMALLGNTELTVVVLWMGAGAAAVISSSVVGNRSAGALDNASGVSTVLGTIDRLPPAISLGVVLTSGEELALAGARAWASAFRGPAGSAINIDIVDDRGVLRCMTHGPASRRLAAGIARALASRGATMRVQPLIPGILTDGVALADAGWSVVTLSRGTLNTLARIHRPTDCVGAMTGEGATDLAGVLASYLSHRA